MNLWLVLKYRLRSHDRMRVHVQIVQMLESKPTNYNWAFELTSGTAVAPGLALKHVRMSWARVFSFSNTAAAILRTRGWSEVQQVMKTPRFKDEDD